MAYAWPTSLSPSRVESFTSCPLAFRFASIQKLPEPPSPHAARGTLVHRALELLLCEEPALRTAERAHALVGRALADHRDDPELVGLDLDDPQLVADLHGLVDRYLAMEDPTTVHAIGLELRLSATVGDLTLNGIIDRLELDPGGGLVVTDYKTGRAPSPGFEQRRLGGVHFYAFLCEQVFGQRPSRVQLYYLRSGEIIVAHPSEQSTRYLPKRTEAVHVAIKRACAAGDFRPRPSGLCASCSFQRWCPAFGGDPDRAALEVAGSLFTTTP